MPLKTTDQHVNDGSTETVYAVTTDVLVIPVIRKIVSCSKVQMQITQSSGKLINFTTKNSYYNVNLTPTSLQQSIAILGLAI